MNKKLSFNGSGAGLLLQIIKVYFLTLITCGIYYPWGVISIEKYIITNYKLDEVNFGFTGKGLSFFVKVILKNIFLSVITLGIYFPIAIYNVYKYVIDNTTLNGEAFTLVKKNMLKLYLLILAPMISLVIYTISIVNMFDAGIFIALLLYLISIVAVSAAILKLVISNLKYKDSFFVLEEDTTSLTKLFAKNYALSILTLGIYGAWANANIYNTVINSIKPNKDSSLSCNMSGLDLFIIYLKGFLFSMITFGIYYPWFIASIMKYIASCVEVTTNDVEQAITPEITE